MKIAYCETENFKPGLCFKCKLKKMFKKIITLLNQPKNLEVNLSFVSEMEIRKLNKEIRGIDKVTDVLSFPALDIKAGENALDKKNEFEDSDNIIIGDMAICVAVAKKQAEEFGEKVEDEILHLFVHSILHLLGYDHIADEDYVVMHEKEVQILGDKYKD